ncbi:hypothetical protein [Paenibacillus sp. SI8]|uniref:hypothetical protein n=1 Tax=unclassified Paenibacillus TaxID=185978 RepID=UPI0034664D09
MAFLKNRKTVVLFLIFLILSTVGVLVFSNQEMIDKRPMFQGATAIGVLIGQYVQLSWIFVLIGVTFLFTRKKTAPDLISRSPEKSVSQKEAFLILVYSFAVLLIGHYLGKLMGYHGFGMHMHGSFYGLTDHDQVSPNEMIGWTSYNFVFLFVIPYLYTRFRGYSHESLNLKSMNRGRDFFLILVILILESLWEISVNAQFFKLSPHQMVVGGMLAFILNFLGTVLPAMFIIYCFLLPRFYRLTGSALATTLLGGFTYAGFHLFEYWTAYDSLTNAIISISLVFLQFVGPGIIKSYLTLRSGNAWVHVWSYHAIAPHVIADTPEIVDIFEIQK